MFSIDIYMHLMTWSVDFLKGVNRATWNHFVEGFHDKGHEKGGNLSKNDLMERLISVCCAGGWGPIHKSWQAGKYEVAAITDR